MSGISSKCPLSECALGPQRRSPVVASPSLGEPRASSSISSVPYRTHFEEHVWPVTRVGYEERVVEVPQVVMRERVEEQPRVVYAEKIRYIPKPELVERTTHIPKRVEKEVLVDVPQVQYVHRTVPVPAPIFQEEVVAVPHRVVKEVPVYVSKPVFVEKVVEVPRVQLREVPVEKIVEVPQVRFEYKYKDVAVPRQVFRTVTVPKELPQPRSVFAGKGISSPVVEVRQASAPVSEPVCLFNCCTSPRREDSQASAERQASSSLSFTAQPLPARFYSQPPATPAFLVEGVEKKADGAVCCGLPTTPRSPKKKDRRASTPSTQRGRFILTPNEGSRKPIDVKVSKLSPRKARGACGMCTGTETPVESDVEHREYSYPAAFRAPIPPYYSSCTNAPLLSGEPWIRTKFGDMPFSEFERLNNSDALAGYLKTLGGCSQQSGSEKISLDELRRAEKERLLQLQEELARKEQQEKERVKALVEWQRQELLRQEEIRKQREEAAKKALEEKIRLEEEARRQREEEEKKAREEQRLLEERRRQREEEALQRYIEEQRRLAEEQQERQLKQQQDEIQRLLEEQERQRKEQEIRQAQFLQQQQETLKRLQQQQLKQQKQLQDEMKEHQQRLAQQQDQLRVQQEQAVKKLQAEHAEQQQRLAARLQQAFTWSASSATAAQPAPPSTFANGASSSTRVYVETRFGLMAYEDFERLNREDPLKNLTPAVAYEPSTHAPSPSSAMSTARYAIPSELLYREVPGALKWQPQPCQVVYAPQGVVYHSQEETWAVNPRLLDFSVEGREARSQAEEIGRTSAAVGRHVYQQVRGAWNSEASVEALRAVGNFISGVFQRPTSTAPVPPTQ